MPNSDLQYIRDYYQVPAEIGGRVRYTYGGERFGTIVGAREARLLIRLDATEKAEPFHPTWELEYLGSGNTRPNPPEVPS